ncbi:MAG: hypothetical protein ACFE9L_02540 [Candidatus Hodarchaeota archaeon]
MVKEKRRISRKEPPCVNHPNNYGTKECKRCNQYFCSECYIEDWHETFFHQFLAQKREVIKTVYCKPCQRRVVRVRMIGYIGFLIILTLPLIITVIIALT